MVAMKRNLWHLGTIGANVDVGSSTTIRKLSLLNLIGIVPVAVALTAAAIIAFVVEVLWDRRREPTSKAQGFY